MFPDGEPLSWFIRVKIALDSARGLEYIHEHTVPRACIYSSRHEVRKYLSDKNFCAKVQSYSITFLTLFSFFWDNSETLYYFVFRLQTLDKQAD